MLDRFLKKPVFELQECLQHGNIKMYTLLTHPFENKLKVYSLDLAIIAQAFIFYTN